MKTRIVGSILVLAVLAVLVFLTDSGNNAGSASTSVPVTPADNDLKSLKIN